MKKIGAAALALVLGLGASPAYAEEFSAGYVPSANQVIYAGSVATGELVKIMVLPEGLTPESLTGTETGIFMFSQETGEDGSFEGSFSFAKALPESRYQIYAACGDYIGSSVLLPADAAELSAFVTALSAKPESAWANDMLQNLPMDRSAISAYGEQLAGLLYAQAPKGGYTADSFAANYTFYEGVLKWKHGDITLDQLVAEYGGYAGEGLNEGYAGKSDAVKASADKILSGYQLKTQPFDELLNEALFVAECINATDSTQLSELVTAYFEEHAISAPVYNGLSTDYKKARAFELLYQERSGFTTASGIRDALETAAQTADDEGSNSNSGSGSNGGSGGSSGGSSSGTSGNIIGLAPSTSQTDEQKTSFQDIAGHWAEEDILSMYDSGFVNGYEDGSFRPDNQVTRGEFVKMMVEMFGEKAAYSGEFDDVASGAWYADYVSGAVRAGWIKGVDENHFAPEEKITREDAATMIDRMLQQRNASGGKADESVFSDFSQVSDYAREAVLSLANAGILKGSDGLLLPKAEITRAETVVVCLRALEQL